MKELISEIRMYFAEKLLSWALRLADKNRTDGVLLRTNIYQYFIDIQKICKK
jgi:hypothetical protein